MNFSKPPELNVIFFFVDGVTPVKTVNFELYPSVETTGTARYFVNVPVNCT